MRIFPNALQRRVPGGYSATPSKARSNLIKKIVWETKRVIKLVENELTEARALSQDLEKEIRVIDEEHKSAKTNMWALLRPGIEQNDKLTPGEKENQIKRLEETQREFEGYEKSIEQIENKEKSNDAAEERYVLEESKGIAEEHKQLKIFLQILEQYNLHPGDLEIEKLKNQIDNIIRLHKNVERYQGYILRWENQKGRYKDQLEQFKKKRDELAENPPTPPPDSN